MGLLRKNERGYGLKPRNLGVNSDLYEFYLMLLSREIDIKLCQCYEEN